MSFIEGVNILILKTGQALPPIIAAIFFVSVSAHSKPTSFNLNRGAVTIDVPVDWQSAPDLFGMPLVLLGPDNGERRPVITLTPTGIENLNYDPKGLKNDQAGYKNGREKWLSKHNGKAVKFFPYENIKSKDSKQTGVTDIHKIGYEYQISGKEFIEESYFVTCKNKLYHLKSVLNKKHEKQFSKIIKDIIGSFSCA